MDDKKERLLAKFFIANVNALFAPLRQRLDVADDGLAGYQVQWSPVLDRTLKAIESKAPEFVVDSKRAFWPVMPELADPGGIDPEHLRDLSHQYLVHLGEVVGADLVSDDLVKEYVSMLSLFVAFHEADRAAVQYRSRPGA